MLLYRRPPLATSVQWRYFGSKAAQTPNRDTSGHRLPEMLQVKESDLHYPRPAEALDGDVMSGHAK